MNGVEVKKGLEGVYAAESGLGFVDGERGILRYRGYDIKDLAESCRYEEVCYLLWFGELPNGRQLEEFSLRLKENRKLPDFVVEWIKSFPRNAHPLDVLRTVVSALAFYDDKLDDVSKDEIINKAIRLTAKFPVIIAAFERIREGKEVVEANNELGHAANFLYMLKGKRGSEFEEKVMDVCFVLHAEHELNASAFAARVSVSTLADVYSGIVSAIATFKGPLHGGANEAVLKMLKEVNRLEEVESYIMNKLNKKEKIMGFGHRVYKVKDPRAHILEKFVKELGEKKGDLTHFFISKEIERVVERELAAKRLFANVDFYSAVAYHYLGINEKLFPAIFACCRVAGWIAHIIEQYKDNRLMRPLSVYKGVVERSFAPIDRR